MRVLVACAESQAGGHEAWSCDLLPTSGAHPEWHLRMDVFNAIERHTSLWGRLAS